MPAGDGLWIQQMAAADIADSGVSVTLPGDNVQPAMQLFDLKEIVKYIVEDGELLGRGKIVCVLVFAGTLHGTIKKLDPLVVDGVNWVAQEIYPSWIGNVCTQLAVACYPPGV